MNRTCHVLKLKLVKFMLHKHKLHRFKSFLKIFQLQNVFSDIANCTIANLALYTSGECNNKFVRIYKSRHFLVLISCPSLLGLRRFFFLYTLIHKSKTYIESMVKILCVINFSTQDSFEAIPNMLLMTLSWATKTFPLAEEFSFHMIF